jgi:hypothetical protein
MAGLTGEPVHTFKEDAGIKVAVGATTVEITSLLPGKEYQLNAVGGDALIRVGADDASSANGGFDFIVSQYSQMHWRSRGTTINVIEADATSAATAALYISEVDDSQT